MGVEALGARHGATLVSPCSGAPARRPARLPVPQPASARTPWPTVSTQQRAGEHGGAARLDRHGRPPLPPASPPESGAPSRSGSPPPTPSEPAPTTAAGLPRWLSPASLAGEAYAPSPFSLAEEGAFTVRSAPNVSRALRVSPGRWPSATVCNRRPLPSCRDDADWRPPVLPGRRRLRRSASGPQYSGGLPIPRSGSLASAPPLRSTQSPIFSNVAICSPCQTASTQRQAGGFESAGHSSHRPRAARRPRLRELSRV